jgi:L-alanine-DL-glutamate epimerase-like enolase superfamily enzyme
MKLKLHQFDLPLRHVFTISRGSIKVQRTLICELQEDGHSGYGEATTNQYYGFDWDRIATSLESVRDELERQTLTDPELLWDQLHDKLHDNPFAQCALDQAAHDLWGKKLGKPVYELWGLTIDKIPNTNYTIGIDRIDVMVSKMREFPDWPVYKIKLGTTEDLEIIRELGNHTNAVFRVDANCGWTADEAIDNARALRELNVEFIEQPLPADQWEPMQRVRRESVLPVIADESCIVPADVEKCAACFDGINIKLVKCGGLTPARRMIESARQLGLNVMVGCMTESSVGISAIAQLLPLLDYVDMDGALLLDRDIASGVTIHQGRCQYPDLAGCGVQLLPEANGDS